MKFLIYVCSTVLLAGGVSVAQFPSSHAVPVKTPCTSTTHAAVPLVSPIVNYNTPVVVTQPILVPATVFQYLPALQPTIVTAVQPIPAVQQAAVTTPALSGTMPAPVAQSANCPTGEALERMVRERVEAVLAARLGVGGPDHDGPPPLLLTGSDSGHTGKLPVPQQPATPQDDARLAQNAVQLLANYCSECHTKGVKASGDITLFTKDVRGLLFAPENTTKSAILAAMRTTTFSTRPKMPPSTKAQLRADELVLVESWLSK